MIIHIKQGTKDTKQEFMDTLELIENQGYKCFEAGCYNNRLKLAEAILIKDSEFEWGEIDEWLNI